ncbi:AraC family transcriptional regulator [Paenibacillus chartarius]|uniref:AraC family transcriptional regulator n=1 Tax=Paenibacillus chartarius TaxID=747481 RepID=A0ABV6DTL3_9BACL
MSSSFGALDSSKVLTAGYSRHTKPFHINQRNGVTEYLLRLQTEGRCSALQNGRMCTILPGDLLLYRPGDPYELRIEGGSEDSPLLSTDYYLFCTGGWIDHWWNHKLLPNKINIPLDETVMSVWRHIIAEKRKLRSESVEITDYLLRVLCLSLDRIVREGGNHPTDSTAYAAYRIRAFVEKHATEHLTLERVADHVGLSVSRAVHLFKETFGQSIMDYAIDVRLSIACERIRFDAAGLEQAAEQSGFNSYSYFHRTFRARLGMSPKEYRSRF